MAKRSAGQKAQGARLRTFAFGLLRRGLFDDSRGRLLVGLAIFGASYARRALQREEEVVYSERLLPGQRLVITHLTETWK